MLREELQLLMEPASHVAEVVKMMGKNKVLVKVNPEGKFVVDIDKKIDIVKLTPNTRVVRKLTKRKHLYILKNQKSNTGTSK